MRNLISILILCTIFSTAPSSSERTAEDCKELGFIKSQLMCSSCELLDEFGLEEIKPSCKECCTQDSAHTETKKYPKAILEVCTCKFGAYPQIQAFIKSDRPLKFPNLKIKYVRGLDPTIKMLDSEGNVKEVLSITKWNTDTVQEFFETHLENDNDKKDYLETNRV